MKSDVLVLGEVHFDPSTAGLRLKDGQPVSLRNKSKAVLLYLLERPNQTVPKSDILSDVWHDVVASDESLVQCVSDIRKVIGKEARAILETVPREGYRLNVRATLRTRRSARLFISLSLAVSALILTWYFWPNSTHLDPTRDTSAQSEVSTGPPGTTHTEAYLEVLQGRVSASRVSLKESLVAERHFRKAIALDPSYARAYAELGTLIAVRIENDWMALYEADKEKALYYAQRAIDLDPDLWLGHYALGRLYSVFSNLEDAERHLRTAMSLQPENEDARAYLGIVLNFKGDAEGAISILEQAVASHPDPPFWYYFGLGHALFNAQNYERAERALNTCLGLAKNSPYCLRYLIALYGETGDVEKAKAATAMYASMGFEVSVSHILSLVTFHHADDQAQFEAGLRRAGVPG